MSRRPVFWLALCILLAAAFLRLVLLDRYPPGPHYDEAANVLIARSVAFGGADVFPIVPNFQGREALYYYLSTPFLCFIDDGRFSLQLVNAFASLITVAVTISLGRLMFKGRRGKITGLMAGALMALSFPLILLAREAFRAPTLPLMQALALLCLWRGLRSRGSLWLVLGGVFAGGALYTYMASRLFPLWLLLAALVLLLLDSGQRLRRLRQGVLFFSALGLTALPMVIFALRNPDIFLGRLYEVTQPVQSITLLESVRRHLLMFFVQGETLLRYNLPGRPYFTWPEGLLLLLGLGIALARLLRRGPARERAAYALALLAPLMILPSVVSVGGFPPNHMRSIGMVPLIFILIGLGAEGLLSYLSARRAPRRAASLPHRDMVRFGLPVMALLAGTLLVANLYFGWASRADLYYETDADLAAAAHWLHGQLDDSTRVYLAARDRNHPTVVIEDLPAVTWLGTDTLFRAPPGKTGLYVFPRSAPPPADWANWLAPYALDDLPQGPDQRSAFQAFRIPGDAPLPESTPVPDDVHNAALRLLGYRAKPIFPGASGDVELQWQVEAPPTQADLTPILQVEDQIGSVLARADIPLIETDHWLAGEVLIARFHVPIPLATPPGEYRLRETWVSRGSSQYLNFLDLQGRQRGIWADAGRVDVLHAVHFPDPDQLPIAHRNPVGFAAGIRLLGWSDLPQSLRPGEFAYLTLYWQALGPQRADFDPTLLLNQDGQDSAVSSAAPDHPATDWSQGEIVAQHLRWQIPVDQASGQYQALLANNDTRVELGALEIAGIPRRFTPPEGFEGGTLIGLGDALGLYGWDIQRQGDTLDLRLVWYAKQPVATDYTVFVHVVDASGAIVAQRDVMPVDNSYPTSLWMAGEYVLDEHHFTDLAPGDYRIQVGLYDQSTGQRLPRDDGSDFIDLGHVR